MGHVVVEGYGAAANSYTAMESANGICVAESLLAQKASVALPKESLHSRILVYFFADACVGLQETEATTLTETLAEATKHRRGCDERGDAVRETAG